MMNYLEYLLVYFLKIAKIKGPYQFLQRHGKLQVLSKCSYPLTTEWLFSLAQDVEQADNLGDHRLREYLSVEIAFFVGK
jgi:hypothetical protein